MSKSFWEKLDIAIRTNLPSLGKSDTSETTPRTGSGGASLDDLKQEAARLRKRIDEALQYEDELQKRVDTYYADIADWDEKADRAVKNGDEDQARFALQRLDHVQKQLEFTEADLREHRYLTQDLISKVNGLETVLHEAENRDADTTASGDLDAVVHSVSDKVSSIYSDIQERMNKLLHAERETPPVESEQQPVQSSPPPEKEKRTTGNDLDDRVSRLSKPDE